MGARALVGECCAGGGPARGAPGARDVASIRSKIAESTILFNKRA